MTDDTTEPTSGANMATTTTVEPHAEALQDAAATVATDIAHDTERDTRHGLSHLEDEFIGQVKRLPLLTADLEEAAKKLLAWIAEKL